MSALECATVQQRPLMADDPVVIEAALSPGKPRWVEFPPAYQVHFWKHASTNPPPPGQEPMWSVVEYRLTGAENVKHVLEWAEAHAGGREFVLYAEVDRGTSRGLVQLLGIDPTVPPMD
jgi:hypothetical protein